MGIQDRDYMRREPPHWGVRRAAARGRLNWLSRLRIAVFFIVLIAGLTYAFKQFGDSKFVVPFPITGEALWYTTPQDGNRAKLTITAPPGGANYAVRLDEWETHRPIVLIPVRGGEVGIVEVPLGRYRITMASGTKWQGPERLFGAASEIQEALNALDFYRVGNTTTGHTIDLKSRINGNMPTRPGTR